MPTREISTLIEEVYELEFIWERVPLDEAEKFVITQVLSNGPLSHNASTLKALRSAVKKALVRQEELDPGWLFWEGRSL